MKFHLTQGCPTPDEYNELRRSVGWPTFEKQIVTRALQNTLHAVLAHDAAGKLIGMARVVGDGAIYFHVQDVIVRPEFQRYGVGTLLMDRIMEYITPRGTAGTNVDSCAVLGAKIFTESMDSLPGPMRSLAQA